MIQEAYSKKNLLKKAGNMLEETILLVSESSRKTKSYPESEKIRALLEKLKNSRNELDDIYQEEKRKQNRMPADSKDMGIEIC